MTDTLIIYDAEYWADEGSMHRNWQGETDHPPYLIQFSAIKVKKDKNLSELSRLSVYVNPVDEQGNTIALTPYFEALTHITQATLDEKGISIPTALQKVAEFVGESPCYSYGRDDKKISISCRLWKQKMPLKEQNCHDVRHILRHAGMSNADIANNSSGTLANFHGLEFTGHVHNAEDDCVSILTTLRHYIQIGALNLEKFS